MPPQATPIPRTRASALQLDVTRVCAQLALGVSAHAGSASSDGSTSHAGGARQAGGSGPTEADSACDCDPDRDPAAYDPQAGASSSPLGPVSPLLGATVVIEQPTDDGLLVMDIALNLICGTKVAVEVDGPTHYTANEVAFASASERVPSQACDQSTPGGHATKVDGPAHHSVDEVERECSEQPVMPVLSADEPPSCQGTQHASGSSGSSAAAAQRVRATRLPLGSTQLRDRCLVRRGWAVVGVRWWEWDALGGDDGAKVAYIEERVRGALARAPASSADL